MENPLCAGQCKAQEDDVARHVGDEHVAQGQIAEGVDQPGDERQRHQQRRQRTVPAVAPRHQGLAQFCEEGHGRCIPGLAGEQMAEQSGGARRPAVAVGVRAGTLP